MPEERDEEPKIRIVDRRMLNEEERQGRAPVPDVPEENAAPPKLEIIGGGPSSAPQESMDDPSPDDLEGELTAEEAEQLRLEIEAEQFAEIEQRMGRPLTEQEKNDVRAEMERRAQSAASLEVAPMLLEIVMQMRACAEVHMGFQPNPYTGLIARNDTQARLAIDAFGALLSVVNAQLPPEASRELERILNDLRVNFTSITGSKITGNTPGPGGFGGPRIIH